MDYSVELRIDKHKYDKEYIFDKNIPILEWLYANVGRPNIGEITIEDADWSHPPLRYDGPDIISIYRFRHAKDAIMFTLKWKRDDIGV